MTSKLSSTSPLDRCARSKPQRTPEPCGWNRSSSCREHAWLGRTARRRNGSRSSLACVVRQRRRSVTAYGSGLSDRLGGSQPDLDIHPTGGGRRRARSSRCAAARANQRIRRPTWPPAASRADRSCACGRGRRRGPDRQRGMVSGVLTRSCWSADLRPRVMTMTGRPPVDRIAAAADRSLHQPPTLAVGSGRLTGRRPDPRGGLDGVGHRSGVRATVVR